MNIAAYLQGAITLLWVVVFGLFVSLVVRIIKKKSIVFLSLFLMGMFFCAMSMSVLNTGFVFVEPDERVVVVSPYAFRAPYGYLEEALTPGLHWIVPGEAVFEFYALAQTYDASIQAETENEQKVIVDVSVVYAINVDEVVQLFIDWQDDYEDNFVRPTTNTVVHDVFSLSDVVEVQDTRYSSIETKLFEGMKESFVENNLILIDVVIQHIRFE